MATKKYLDYEGVKYLWSKINGKIDDTTKYETVNLTITTDSGGGGLDYCYCNRRWKID